MNVTPFLEKLAEGLKEAVLSPKDQFERVKGRATRALILPVIAIAAGDSIITTVLGAVGSLQWRSGENFFRLVGSASDSFWALSGVVVLSFFSIVGSNLYYARHVRKSQEDIARLEREAKLAASYQVLKSRFEGLARTGLVEEAYAVASVMFRRFPEYVEQDSDFLQDLLSDGNLAAIKQLQTIVPERAALTAGAGTLERPTRGLKRTPDGAA